MTKPLIILNLLFSLVFLPVAQAFVMPAETVSHSDSEHDVLTLCQDMTNAECDLQVDCQVLGMHMHCVDSSNLAVFLHNPLLHGLTKSRLLSSANDDYHYLYHLEILRPPRFLQAS